MKKFFCNWLLLTLSIVCGLGALTGCAGGPGVLASTLGAIPGVSLMQDSADLERLMRNDTDAVEMTVEDVRQLAARPLPSPPGISFEIGLLRRALASFYIGDPLGVRAAYDLGLKERISAERQVLMTSLMASSELAQGRPVAAKVLVLTAFGQAKDAGLVPKLAGILLNGCSSLVDASVFAEAEACVGRLPGTLDSSVVLDKVQQITYRAERSRVLGWLKLRQGDPDEALRRLRSAQRDLDDAMKGLVVDRDKRVALERTAQLVRFAEIEALNVLGRLSDSAQLLEKFSQRVGELKSRTLDYRLPLARAQWKFLAGDYAGAVAEFKSSQSMGSLPERTWPLLRRQQNVLRMKLLASAGDFDGVKKELQAFGPIELQPGLLQMAMAQVFEVYVALETGQDPVDAAMRLRKSAVSLPEGGDREPIMVHHGLRVMASLAAARKTGDNAEWLREAVQSGRVFAVSLRRVRVNGELVEQFYPRHVLVKVKAAYAESAVRGLQAGVATMDDVLDAVALAQEGELDAAAIAAAQRRTGAAGLNTDELRQLEDAKLAARKAYADAAGAAQGLDVDPSQLKSLVASAQAAQAQVEKVVDAIERSHPGYRSKMQSAPVTLKAVRDRLGPEDVLVVTHQGAEHLLVVVVSAGAQTARLLPVGRSEVQGLVDRVRTSVSVDDSRQVRPFDTEAASRIFETTLGWAKSAMGIGGRASGTNRQMTWIATGPLASIPAGLLLTEPAKAGATYASANWLVRRFALVQAPTLGSWQVASSQPALASAQGRSAIAWANPLYDASKGGTPEPGASSGVAVRGPGVAAVAASGPEPGPGRKPRPPAEALRALDPLAETEKEARQILQVLGASGSRLVLGRDATVDSVLQASRQGELLKRRAVLFATHGLAPSEVEGLPSPGLALAEDKKSSELPLLTVEHILSLQMDADWVILSACNSAAADKPNGDALGGMARAFLYAGARSVLVTHWPVESHSALEITTGTLRAQVAGRGAVTGAQALRQSALNMIDGKASGKAEWAHPLFWAPFTLVGAGRR